MNQYERLEKARERVIEAIAKNMDLYGITPSVGRLYGTIYFHNQPMTLEDMGKALGMSKTSMSTGVRTLLDLKMVNKKWQRGTRKDLYMVEEDWHQSFIDFFCLKWRRGININKEAIYRSLLELRTIVDDENMDLQIKEQAAQDIEKLQQALDYYHWLNRLVDSFESHEIFDYIPRKTSTKDRD